MAKEKINTNSIIKNIKTMSQKWQGMLFISFFIFLVVLSGLFFQGKIFFDSDLVTSTYPSYYFYQNSLREKNSIFWNPYNFSGFPSYIGSMGYLSPVFYIFYIFLPFSTAYNLIVFLNLTLALFFTWQLLIKFNLPFKISFVGGLIYVFSQWQFISSTAIVGALPILPLMFLLIWRSKEKKWSVFAIGLLIGYGFLSVHPNWLVMILSASFLFALFLDWSDHSKWFIPFKFLLSCLLGTIIGLPVILPLLKYSALSSRATGLSYQAAATGALSLGDFLRYFLPYFRFPIFNLAVSPAQLYLGILPLFFLLLALRVKQPLVRFFSFLFFLCLLTSVGYSPLFWVLCHLPIFNSFRGPDRWMFIGSFAGAILACFGFWQFLAQEDKWQKLLQRGLRLVGCFLLTISVFFSSIFFIFKDRLIFWVNNYFDKYLYAQTSGLSIEYYHKVIANLIFETEQLFSVLNPKVFLSIIFIFLSWFVLQRKKFSAIALVLILNFSVLSFYYQTVSSKVFFNQPETVKFLKRETKTLQTKRIFSFLPGFSEYNKIIIPYQPKGTESFLFQSEMITPNLNLLYNLESIDYYDNLMSRSMSRILALIGSDRVVIGDKLSDLKITPEEKVKKLEEQKKFLDLLGVYYIVSAFPLNEQKFHKVFETIVPPYGIPVSIYENKEARPLVYFASDFETIKPSEEMAYQKLLVDSLKNNSVFIECSDCFYSEVDGKGDIILKSRENGFASLKTKSENNQLLVFSENYLPGWKAYLDKKITSIYTVNTVYMGIFIPAGEHEVIFKYYPYEL